MWYAAVPISKNIRVSPPAAHSREQVKPRKRLDLDDVPEDLSRSPAGAAPSQTCTLQISKPPKLVGKSCSWAKACSKLTRPSSRGPDTSQILKKRVRKRFPSRANASPLERLEVTAENF